MQQRAAYRGPTWQDLRFAQGKPHVKIEFGTTNGGANLVGNVVALSDFHRDGTFTATVRTADGDIRLRGSASVARIDGRAEYSRA